jgi:hypothetical protein
MWRTGLQFSRSFSQWVNPLTDKTAYLVKLAARKPPPILLETDLEEKFIRGPLPQYEC